jgi:hypothetical protein
MTVDELHRTVVEGLAALRRENREFRAAIDARFREQEETIRRHFDVMVEKVEASVRLVAEGHAHLTTVVGNHEVRLQAIEKRF